MECGDCASAQDWMSSFNPEDDEMMDYVTVQGINIKRLCNPRTFTPSEEDLYTLYPLTQEVYPYAAYARSLWHILTGESIFLPLPGITRDVKQRSVSDDAGSWSLYPNPTSGQLTITFDAPIESGQILITDQLGRCIKEHVIEKQSEYQLNVSNYDSGVHYVRVSTGDRLVYIDKFIVQ